MARQAFRGMGLIGLAAGLLLGSVTVMDRSPAEARMGGGHGGFHGGVGGGFRGGFHGGVASGFRGGFHGGVGPGFHSGFAGPFAVSRGFVVNRTFANPVVVNRTFVTNRVFVGDRFFFNPFFHRNVFFFNVGIGGFSPFYPVAYPYPYQYYPSYSPCGYYDPYGGWVNAPCPPYAPSAWAPQYGPPPSGVYAPPPPPPERTQGTQPSGE
jgi:hypothetical protein